MDQVTVDEFARWLDGPDAPSPPPGSPEHAVVVDLDRPGRSPTVGSLPYVVIGVTATARAEPTFADVVVTPAELEPVLATVSRTPLAATALALLLRGAPDRTVADGLIAESTTYSMLQSGPEFAAWRAEHPARVRPEEGPAVLVARDGGRLRVTLNRPAVLNALNTAMRDELVAALSIARADPTVSTVELTGAGRGFCAGGDLAEFGARAEPASAHLIRLTQSPARLLSHLAARTTARLHGVCFGSGIELPAFAGRVVAASDTRIALPELGLGLIPGAGGTVSLPRRIGRLRTAWLALTRATIDAGTALAWGLVDEICDAQ